MEYLVAGTALIFIMGNIADSKIKKSKQSWLTQTDDDSINFISSYRSELSYSKYTKKIVNLITANKKAFPDAIVGSGKFRIQSYPGDVDLMEKIEVCCSKNDIANYVCNKLQFIAKNIKKSKQVYLGDFKAGLDHRYNIKIGWLNLNYKLVGYSKTYVIKELNRLYSEKLLNKKQKNELIALLPPNSRDRHIHQWEKFKKEYRKYYVIRWSIDAVIKGYKNIGPKNNKIKLDLKEAIKHRTIVKLDVWAEVDENLFTEVTNVFLLLWNKKGGKSIFLNSPMGNYPHKLLYEIRHYSRGIDANYMKALKRMWTLANYMNKINPGSEKKYLSKLKSLFTNDLSILYQLYAEIETIVEMISRLRNPPYKKLIKQIDRFKNRFNVVWDGLPQPEFINIEIETYKRIDKIVKEMSKPMNKINRKFLIKHLNFIRECFHYLWNGKPDVKFFNMIIKFKHHLNQKHVGEKWNVKEWPESRWEKEEYKDIRKMKDVLENDSIIKKFGFERGVSSEISEFEAQAWGVRGYILNRRIDINHFDYLLDEKYILKKPVPSETIDDEKYEESYVINPDLTYS